jgi:hypothetical protein
LWGGSEPGARPWWDELTVALEACLSMENTIMAAYWASWEVFKSSSPVLAAALLSFRMGAGQGAAGGGVGNATPECREECTGACQALRRLPLSSGVLRERKRLVPGLLGGQALETSCRGLGSSGACKL